ncbi:MAG: 5-methylcytosine-specific restriction protein B [Saprospiraceae bacterium]|jgi:5-methylcytosine-specific restriction protein B
MAEKYHLKSKTFNITKMPNYWIFQVNPKTFDIINALKNEALTSFSVVSHKNRIEKGDKVILWQCRKNTGCFALCEVASDVSKFEPSASELPYFLDKSILEKADSRVLLTIEYNLWNKPITSEMLYSKAFEQFNVGLPGTNFQATESQYTTLVSIIETLDIVYETLPPYETRKKERKPLNLILFGPPGTGKTYHTLNHAIAIIEGKSLIEVEIENQQYRYKLKERYEAYQQNGQIAFVTFHPSMSYEDFIEGIKPKEENKQVYYEIEDGIFKNMSLKATQNPNSNYVLIIDEISRGNVAQIFGELITLIESDKRSNKPEATQTLLPYSKQSFSVPPNLYIIGTMNTADRSVEALDTALRRRFFFEEMAAKPSLLHSIGDINLKSLLKTINQRIEILLDKDYQIGHAYFMGIHTLEDLCIAFANKILPLLKEYFYGDWGKIGLILGEGFIQKKSHPFNGVFSNFDYEYKDDFENRIIYELTEIKDWDESIFRGIYE